jgi:phosphonate ABC transporter permease subunit PhnE
MTHVIHTPRTSPLHGLLSLVVPGLGQFVAKARTRGLIILISTLTLIGLSVWTIAQRARFPNYALSLDIFSRLVVACALILVFLLALRHLLARSVLRENPVEAFSGYGVGLLYIAAVLLASDQILATAGTSEAMAFIHPNTALYAAAALAGLWIWQVLDAARIGGMGITERLPSMALAIVIMCVLIFSLGYNITGIDMPKAIREYQDISVLLPRMIWPWRAAFAYDQDVVEETQLIQAPCPAGEVGPPPNEPEADEAWISATPTCGEMSIRAITGDFTLGTELTIIGGNFTPGQVVRILWKNPIGNPFTPRGVGPTDITIDENGEFVTQLNIPDVVIPDATSAGAQIHTLVVRQESVEVFSGRFSADMKQALVGMLETIMIGLMATFFGIIFAFPMSFLAAKNLMSPIVSPLERLVGSAVGLVTGIWVAVKVMQQVAPRLGGLENAPIQVFLVAAVVVGVLGYAGMRIGGRLFATLLGALGRNVGLTISALLLAAMAAVPGYYLGLGFSRGIRAIILGADVAVIHEQTYAYLGAAVVALLALVYAYSKRNAKGISIGLMIYTVTRTMLNIVRSVEPLIWAIVATIWVGLGAFAGTIALTLHTIASLAKLYSEAIESIDPGPLEAVESTGATRLQTISYAVVPQILPPFISFTIYRWDINVRMSTIIGFVGGGGIGFILLQWIRLYQYESVGIAVWLITITVAALDYISSEIRERFI